MSRYMKINRIAGTYKKAAEASLPRQVGFLRKGELPQVSAQRDDFQDAIGPVIGVDTKAGTVDQNHAFVKFYNGLLGNIDSATLKVTVSAPKGGKKNVVFSVVSSEAPGATTNAIAAKLNASKYRGQAVQAIQKLGFLGNADTGEGSSFTYDAIIY